MYSDLWGWVPSQQRDSECQHAFDLLSERMSQTSPTPLGSGELHIVLTKLKRGASGMSNELLVALVTLMGSCTPSTSTQTFPEARHVSSPKSRDIRSILLLEVLQKLFATVLMTPLN